jgi:predicted dehydrogenase
VSADGSSNFSLKQNAQTEERRKFLKRAAGSLGAASLFPALIPASALGANDSVPPSNRIALGFIGTGSHGIGMNLQNFLRLDDAQVVAVCDVDSAHMQRAKTVAEDFYAQKRPEGTYQGCKTTGDWREIVARDDTDAVVISTPDHWHVLPAVAAARAGKDVLCEKPLTLTVQEGRVLSDTMARYGRVFQTASENRSKRNFLRACELVRNGRIGKLHTIRTELPKGHSRRPDYGTIQQPQPVPAGFDYDMWLGPAPEKPYTPGRCHWNFRWILDYSGGNLTDWGAHINDVAQWGNDTEYTGPVSVDGRGVFPSEGLYDAATEWDITFEYANGVTLICRSGSPSIRFEGTDGWVFCKWDTIEASSPAIINSVIGPEEVHLRTCPGREQRDFLDCVKTRQPTYAPAEVGHRSITLSHIGNISMMLGRKLRWNPDTERFSNDDQANRMLSRAMRSPWRL